MVNQIDADILIEKIKSKKNKIVNDSNNNNKLAIKLIETYSFWHKCPGDAMAFILCEEAYENYMK